jgi:hypothetical protein
MEAEPTPLFEKPTATHELVALADIKPWSTGGAKTANDKSITALGLRSVITLQQLPPGSQYRYKVIDGSRRLNTARDKGLEHVQAEVLPEETDRAEAAALRFVLNLGRSPNPMHEAEALQEVIDACLAAGIPRLEVRGHITRTLGVSASVINQRLGLLLLPAALRQGVKDGKVAAGVAAKIANLTRVQQEQLVWKLEAEGKLTSNMVKDVRRVKREATLAELPDNLFAPPDNPKARARAALEGFLDEGLTAGELKAAVEQLEDERRVF